MVFVDADNRIVELGTDPGDVPLGFGLMPSGIGRVVTCFRQGPTRSVRGLPPFVSLCG